MYAAVWMAHSDHNIVINLGQFNVFITKFLLIFVSSSAFRVNVNDFVILNKTECRFVENLAPFGCTYNLYQQN
jgi:hypothetical protein